MKDLPHHLNKLNRKIIRSVHHEQIQEENYEQCNAADQKKQTAQQMKKQAKDKKRLAANDRVILPDTPEERNRKMKHRTPVFDRTNDALPRSGARASRKKIPRL